MSSTCECRNHVLLVEMGEKGKGCGAIVDVAKESLYLFFGILNTIKTIGSRSLDQF